MSARSGSHGDLPAPMRVSVSERFRFGALFGATLLFVVAALVAGSRGWLDRETLRATIAAGGPWAPVWFVVAGSLLPLGWVPRSVVTATGGALFGTAAGAGLGLLAGVLAALAGYGMGRALGADYVARRMGPRGRAFAGFLSRRGFLAVFLGRTCPLMNCEAVSLASGLLALPMRRYVAATLAAMAPTSLLYAAIGSSIVAREATTLRFTVAVVYVATTIVTAAVLWRAWRTENPRQPA